MVESQVTSLTPATHADRHAVAGDDPIPIDSLNTQTATNHASSHDRGGSDPITLMSDVTASHGVLNAIHQNTSGVIQLHFVRLLGGGADTWTAYAENATPPTDVVGAHLCPPNNAVLTFLVPNNYYYKVNSSDGTNTIDSWYIL